MTVVSPPVPISHANGTTTCRLKNSVPASQVDILKVIKRVNKAVAESTAHSLNGGAVSQIQVAAESSPNKAKLLRNKEKKKKRRKRKRLGR